VITDLKLGGFESNIRTEILIIGAGVAGLFLAHRLREHGKQVVVLESGAREQSEDTHPFNEVVQIGDDYRGALHGRFRCLGGTSSRWGGALLPFLEQDFAARDYYGISAWPVSYQEVIQYLPDLERLFSVDAEPYDQQFILNQGLEDLIPYDDPEFVARFAKWPTFGRRNLSVLFGHRIEGDAGLNICINATATDFQLDASSGRLIGVRACHPGGNTLTVQADQTVICAGAIESTRLLLLLDAQYNQRVFAGCNALGRYFHDHVSTVAAKIVTKDIHRLNRMAGFRFVGSTMRSLRFELSPRVQREEKVGSAFGHITFKPTFETGFDAIRTLMRAIQKRTGFPANLPWRIVRDTPYIINMMYWRAVRKQLYWPAPADYFLNIVVEQKPVATSSIALSHKLDGFGKQLAEINWCVGESEHSTCKVFLRRFNEFWARNGMSSIGVIEPIGGLSSGGEDIFHPGGSTRMGTNSRDAVLSNDLQCYAVPNLWVASTSAFPSGASANPTLMLMLFSMRLAQRLSLT
jgi:choline dehydrogenase-like flavoprotein